MVDGSPTPPAPVASVDLRPLTTSELIDRGFALYRQNFAGLFLLALLCQIGPAITSQAMLDGLRIFPSTGTWLDHPETDPRNMGVLLLVYAFDQIITFCLEVAFITYLAEAYLGGTPSIKAGFLRLKGCLAAAIKTSLLNMLLLSLTLIFPLLATIAVYIIALFHPPQQFWGLVLYCVLSLLLLVASVAPLLIVFMRLMVTIPAVALEHLSGWQAVKRSFTLVRYDPGLGPLYWGEMRLSFLLLPLFVIELLALSLTSLPITLHEISEIMQHGAISQMAAPESAKILSKILVLLSSSLLLPLYLIATTLFYYDVRVRREGFDLERMAAQARPGL